MGDPRVVRNICILAHVDHGKTTLSDSLLSSNGIISERSAGTMRYLDDTEEEQRRGITMKSNAISLKFTDPATNQDHLINVLDSPGHVDFTADVSTALRVCDGALIIVDVVEGVCVQTRQVLRQAFSENVKPTLILNKIDRLLTYLKLSEEEAFIHLQKIIEEMNVLMSEFHKSEILLKGADFVDIGDKEEKQLFFSPIRGNVLFASSIDCWAFDLQYWAEIFSKKLGQPPSVLRRAFWGNYYWKPKEKKIVAKSNKLKPMFAQFVLASIWQVYDKIMFNPDPEGLARIIRKQKLNVNKRDIQEKNPRSSLRAVMRSWLPLSLAVLKMVVRRLPSPFDAQKQRLEKLWPITPKEDSPLFKAFSDMSTCSSDEDSETVVFVSKMIAIPQCDVPGASETQSSDSPEQTVFVGLARVFSGVLKSSSELRVLNAQHDPEKDDVPAISGPEQPLMLFRMMGRKLIPVDSVPAGHVCGIVGLQNHVLNNATLSTTSHCMPLIDVSFISQVVVRVAVEPLSAADLPLIMRGLHLLSQSDPCVKVFMASSGELVLSCIGELHLERCIELLKNRFTAAHFKASEPMVAFRETIISPTVPTPIEQRLTARVMPELVGGNNVVVGQTANKNISWALRALPLPKTVVEYLDENHKSISSSMEHNAGAVKGEILSRIQSLFEEAGHPWKFFKDSVLAFGPRSFGVNMLLNGVHDEFGNIEDSLGEHLGSIVSGFQAAADAGPLCEEPMYGVCFVLEKFVKAESEISDGDDPYGPLSGQVISSIKETCRKAFKCAQTRLVQPVFLCSLQCSQRCGGDVIGKLCSVLYRRHGQILHEDILDGTDIFVLESSLPVVESFGVANELRTKTSGAVSNPQLTFLRWELLDVDPFFRPTTEEEIEEWGEDAVFNDNLAKVYINKVRERKGLRTDKMIVVAAEKQRTLSRKK